MILLAKEAKHNLDFYLSFLQPLRHQHLGPMSLGGMPTGWVYTNSHHAPGCGSGVASRQTTHSGMATNLMEEMAVLLWQLLSVGRGETFHVQTLNLLIFVNSKTNCKPS